MSYDLLVQMAYSHNSAKYSVERLEFVQILVLLL